MQQLKSQQTSLRLELTIVNSEGSTSIGNVMIDMKGLSKGLSPSYLKVYKCNGASLQVSAKINQIVVNDTSAIALEPEKTADIDPSSSTDSLASVLRLVQKGNPSDDVEVYAITFRFEAFRGLESVCESQKAGTIFIFRWKIFNKYFESDEFYYSDGKFDNLHGFSDTIRIEANLATLRFHLIGELPLQIVLLTDGVDLVSVRIPSSRIDLFPIVNTGSGDGGWYAFSGDVAAVKIMYSIAIEGSLEAFDDVYNDDFEVAYSPSNDSNQDCPGDDDERSVFSDAKPVSKVVQEVKRKAVGFGGVEIRDEQNEEHFPHHFRLTIDVPTVSSLRRAANLVVQFAYPHIDSTSPVYIESTRSSI